jgi:hypothetical protein
MKRYTLIDNKTGEKHHYSYLVWNFAWGIVFVMSVINGILLGGLYL